VEVLKQLIKEELMPSYAQWLKSQITTDPDIINLQSYADGHTTSWPWWSDSKTDYEQHIDMNEKDADRNANLKEALSTSFSAWLNASNPDEPIAIPAAKNPIIEFVTKNMLPLISFLVILIIVFILIWGLFDEEFFYSIAGINQARGFITFLFALSTMGVILLIAASVFWLPPEELDRRFPPAKDLLTVIIGVLGTILGFYFGSIVEGENRERALNIANIGVSSPVAQPSSTVKISATILGGEPPYTYSIRFTDPIGAANTSTMAVESETSDTGAVVKDVVIPPDVSKPTGITFTMIANDAQGAQAHASSATVVAPGAAQ
jgi:hypothetical protein